MTITRKAAAIPDADPLYSIPEVCSTLNIGPTKVWELIRKDLLKAVRLGNRCTRVPKSSVVRLIEHGVPK